MLNYHSQKNSVVLAAPTFYSILPLREKSYFVQVSTDDPKIYWAIKQHRWSNQIASPSRWQEAKDCEDMVNTKPVKKI